MKTQGFGSLLVLSLVSGLVIGCVPVQNLTRVSTVTPTSTLAVVDEHVHELAAAGVTRNADWMPYTEVIDGVEMALVPAGCFMMGSEDGGLRTTLHRVCFEEPFWIDVTEVTQAQFAEFDGQAGRGNHFSYLG